MRQVGDVYIDKKFKLVSKPFMEWIYDNYGRVYIYTDCPYDVYGNSYEGAILYALHEQDRVVTGYVALDHNRPILMPVFLGGKNLTDIVTSPYQFNTPAAV